MDDRFLVRRATLSDTDALSQLCQRTFRETFVEDLAIPYPRKDLEDYFRSSASPSWFADEINHPKVAVWIVQDKKNDEAVAYAVASSGNITGIDHPEVSPNEDGAFNRLYVRRDRQSLGLGRQLMDAVLLWHQEVSPSRPIWLTAFSENIKAQKFYAQYNFHKVGECYYPVGQWNDLEFVMKREPTIDSF